MSSSSSNLAQADTPNPPPASAKVRAREAMAEIARNGVDVHRCAAVQALGKIGDADDVPLLIDCLMDEDEDVRSDAAAALSNFLDPRSAPQLLENLVGDPCGDVKLSALRSLTAMQYEPVVPWLRRLVLARDGEIVWDEDEFFAGGWDDWVDLQVKAIEALGEFRVEDAVPDILTAIADEHGQDLSEVAFQTLAKLGEPGLTALRSFLSDNRVQFRRRAASVFAALPVGVANDEVRQALSDRAGEVRMAAAKVLARKNSCDVRLRPLLSLGDADDRAEAILLFGHAHPDLLSAFIEEDLSEVRIAALKSLSKVSDGAVAGRAIFRSKLLAGVADADLQVSMAAITALARTCPDEWTVLACIAKDLTRSSDVRVCAIKALELTGREEAVPLLTESVGDEHRNVRLAVLAALKNFAAQPGTWPNAAADCLFAAMAGELVAPPEVDPANPQSARLEPEPDTAETAAPAVNGSGNSPTPSGKDAEPDPEVFPTSTLNSILTNAEDEQPSGFQDKGETLLSAEDVDFLSLAHSGPKKRKIAKDPTIAPHQDVRQFAARVLGDVPHRETAKVLNAAVDSEDNELALVAADSLARVAASLGCLTEEVRDRVIESFKRQGNRNIKLLLIRALAFCDAAHAVPVLVGGLEDDDSFVRRESLRSLASLGEQGGNVGRFLDDADPAVRLAAAQVLAGTKSPEAIERLVEFAFAEEGYHAREAARLLRGIDAETATSLFLAKLAQPELRRFWQVAIQALEELNTLEPLGALRSTGPQSA